MTGYLLQWLSKSEFSQYGECHGAELDELIAQGLVQVHKPREHQSGFIVAGDDLMYCAVSLTEKGRTALSKGHAK